MPYSRRNDYHLMVAMVPNQKEEVVFCPIGDCMADKEWGKHRNLCCNCPVFLDQVEDQLAEDIKGG